MENSFFPRRRFFLHVAALSEEDRSNFKLYLESPYHVRGSLHKRIFEAADRLIFSKQKKAFSDEDFWELLFEDGRAFNTNRYSRLLSETGSLLRDFLAIDEFKRREDEQELLAVQAFNRRGIDIESLYEKAVKRKEESTFHNDDHFDFLQRLEWEYSRYLIRSRGRKSKGEALFNRLINLIDEVHYLRRLEITVAAINRDQALGTQNEIREVDYILRHVERDPEKCPTALQYFYHIYCLISPDIDKTPGTILVHFNGADRILQSEHGRCPPGELAEYYGYLLNECFRQINEGNLLFQTEAWRIFKRYLEAVVDTYGIPLSSFYYKNFISLCARLGKFEEAWEFLKKYQNRLTNDSDGIAYNYNEAVLLYYQGDFEEALSKFLRCHQNVEEIFYHLDTRVYLWRCEYELSLLNPDQYPPPDLDHRYDRFRRFVKQSKKISEIHRQNYLTFTSYFKRFITIRQNRKNYCKKLKDQLDKLQEERNIANIQWLSQKVKDARDSGGCK